MQRTSAMSVAMIWQINQHIVAFQTGHTYCCFCHEVQKVVQPSWQEFSTSLREVESTDRAKPNTQTLQEDGKDVGHQHDEEEFVLERGTGRNIRGVVARINVRYRYLSHRLEPISLRTSDRRCLP